MTPPSILHGDCLTVLGELGAGTVHCVVTSPPYWSMRDYEVPPTTWPDGWVGCLGLEPTPEQYVSHLVSVFDAVWRVLRDDGTLWLNLGDCYVAGGRGGDTGGASGLQGSKRGQEESKKAGQRIGHRSSFRRDRLPRGDVAHKAAPGLKPKDLVGIPWMVAFALRARGWYLRCDVVWAKTNPMPESITDRPAKSHEYVFLLAKTERYFYDRIAVLEQLSPTTHASGNRARKDRANYGGAGGHHRRQAHAVPWTPTAASGRNRRSVWHLPTQPFPGAHFATFPPRLVTLCILAGTSAGGCCSNCGAPYRRVTEKGATRLAQKRACGGGALGEYRGKARKDYASAGVQDPSATKARILAGMRERITTGWAKTCRHVLSTAEPCRVLDPFLGSGTTIAVATQLERHGIGIDLNPEYLKLYAARAAKLATAGAAGRRPGASTSPERGSPAE